MPRSRDLESEALREVLGRAKMEGEGVWVEVGRTSSDTGSFQRARKYNGSFVCGGRAEYEFGASREENGGGGSVLWVRWLGPGGGGVRSEDLVSLGGRGSDS